MNNDMSQACCCLQIKNTSLRILSILHKINFKIFKLSRQRIFGITEIKLLNLR